MIGFWSKFKLVVGAMFVALLPLFYAFGMRQGRTSTEGKQLERAVRSQRDQAVFYRDLDGLNEEIDHPRNRTDLVKRLRDEGL